MKLFTILACCCVFLCNSTVAEVLTDGTMGKIQSLSGTMTIPQSLGKTVGNNLFHSFTTFNINNGESVTFKGASSLNNVISRVTGGEISTINGLLKSEVGKANFYFINPAGIVFGNKAQVDVPAAFYLSTADKLNFSDNYSLDSLTPASILTVAEPVSFGFLGNHLADIKIHAPLVFNGNQVSFSSANLTLDNGSLYNPTGSIQLYAVGSSSAAITLHDLSNNELSGHLIIRNDSFNSGLDVSGKGAGQIALRAGVVDIKNAKLYADNNGAIAASAEKGIDVVAQTMNINNSKLTAETDSAGNAANINLALQNGSLIVKNGLIRSLTTSTGQAGNITLVAKNVIVTGYKNTFNNGKPDIGGIYNVTEAIGTNPGNAGIINITTDNLAVTDGGLIRNNTIGAGNAGEIKINAQEILVDGTNNNSTYYTTGIVSNTDIPENGRLKNLTGNAGIVTIASNNLTLLNNATIRSSTYGFGNVGSVTINATKTLHIEGAGSKIASDTFTGTKDTTGAITINADQLELINGGSIHSSTSGFGNGGNVTIQVNNMLINGMDNKEYVAGVYANVEPTTVMDAIGNGGTINIMVNDTLEMTQRGIITADTRSSSLAGNAGNVIITANSLKLDNANISSQAGVNPYTNDLIDVKSITGAAGNVIVHANLLTLNNNASISAGANANSNPQAGNITINADKGIYLSNNSKISLQNDVSTLLNPDEITPGHLSVFAPDIDLINNSKITAQSNGNVSAGEIKVSFAHALTLQNNSNITTQANLGSGGKLTINGGQLIWIMPIFIPQPIV